MKDSKITRMAAAINAGPKILAVGEERFSVELRGEDWFAGAEAVWADLVGNSNADGRAPTQMSPALDKNSTQIL